MRRLGPATTLPRFYSVGEGAIALEAMAEATRRAVSQLAPLEQVFLVLARERDLPG